MKLFCNKGASSSGKVVLGLSAILALALCWTLPQTADAQRKGSKRKAKVATTALGDPSRPDEEPPQDALPPEEELPPNDDAPPPPQPDDFPPPLEETPPEPEDDLPPPVSEEEWLSSSKTEDTRNPLDRPPTPSWMLLITPFGGFLHNQTRVEYLIPQSQEEGHISYLDRAYKTKASSWGAGGMVMLKAHVFTFTDVFYAFPKVGSTSMIGNIAMLNATIPTSDHLQPYLGGGLAFSDLRATMDRHINQETQAYKATMTDFDLRVQSITPIAEIGMRFNLPLQHWSITPVYQYFYQSNMSRATATGLGLEVTSDSGGNPQNLYWPGFASTKKQWFECHNVGAKFFLDFYHILQFSGEVLWNLSQKSLVAKTTLNVMFSKYMGLAAFFEHSELINTTNTSVMVGPTFLFTPKSYFSELEDYKQHKNQPQPPQPPPRQ